MKRFSQDALGFKRSRRSLMLALACGLAATFAAADASAVKNSILLNLMKRMDGYTNAGNMRATSQILSLVKSMGPDEYDRWAGFAEKGRAAAASGDAAGAKAACRSCHEAYREQYRTKYGSKAPDSKDPPVEGGD